MLDPQSGRNGVPGNVTFKAERLRKPKIGITREPIKWSLKVKVTRPINAVTENALYAGRGLLELC